MAEPVSILAGLLTAEAVDRITQRLDNSDDEINQLLHSQNGDISEEQLREAIKLANQDETKFQRFQNAIMTELPNQKKSQGEEALGKAQLQYA